MGQNDVLKKLKVRVFWGGYEHISKILDSSEAM
jgi:hypothetical protein